MMRLAAYAGTSMVLAIGVIVRALYQRANFYSATVYVAQSNACLMILTNLLLLGLSLFMIALQRLAYGPLRVIEIEQLYEKAWFAITETCLAMTVFREEVGGWFLVMFVSLLIGKVWGWLGEGRLEILEQQPPSNPRLFHLRLSSSLALSVIFDSFMLRYSIQTIREQAEPNMMVMFAFEFAVLCVASLSSAARYAMFLHERAVIKEQTRLRRQERLPDNQPQVPNIGEGLLPADGATTLPLSPNHNDDNDLEDEEFDVPGWEKKGFWVFYLDLLTDFLKLVLYLSFFGVLCVFYGMPLHIIRDVAITIRSFYKRIHDFIRYRQATKDMNERYADATREEMAREDVCIICRETMRVWIDEAERVTARQSPVRQQDQRLRPKKLPCGHILHFACLRSWLERQQNCPTCRRPVLNTSSLIRVPHARAQDRQNQQPDPVVREGFAPVINDAQQQPYQNRVRFFNLGPIRLGFGAGRDLRGLANHMGRNERQPLPNQPQIANYPVFNSREGQQSSDTTSSQSSPDLIQRQLHAIEQQLMQQIQSLQAQADQLYLVRTLQGELARIRMNGQNGRLRQVSFEGTSTRPSTSSTHGYSSGFQSFGAAPQNIQTGEVPQNLFHGLSLPDGWTVLPLRRVLDGPTGLTHNVITDNRGYSTGPPLRSSQPPQSLLSNAVRNIEVPASRAISAPSNELRGEARSTTPTAGLVNSTDYLETEGNHEDDSLSTCIAQSSPCDDTPLSESSSAASNLSKTALASDDNVPDHQFLATAKAMNSENQAGGKQATVEDQDDDDSS